MGIQDLTFMVPVNGYCSGKKGGYYSAQWADADDSDGQYEIVDEPEDQVEFDGILIDKKDFDEILGWDKCFKCHKPFQFIDGHKYVKNNEADIVCVHCVEEMEAADEEMKTRLRAALASAK